MRDTVGWSSLKELRRFLCWLQEVESVTCHCAQTWMTACVMLRRRKFTCGSSSPLVLTCHFPQEYQLERYSDKNAFIEESETQCISSIWFEGILNIICIIWGWGGGWVVKRASWCTREPKFSSQHPGLPTAYNSSVLGIRQPPLLLHAHICINKNKILK